MGRKFGKSSHSKTFQNSAGKLRRTNSLEYNKRYTNIFNQDIPTTKGNNPYHSNRFHYTTTDDDIDLPQDRHYSVFQNIDTHTDEEHSHDEGFIKKQKWAAGGVVAVAALADLDQMEKILLGATGAGNVGRNQGWWSAINNIPKNLGRIATFPQYSYAKILHNTAESMDTGVYEANKRLFKSWTRDKSKSINKDNKIKRDAIIKLAENPDDNALKAYLTKMAVKVKLGGHYVNNSPSYLMAQATHSISSHITINKEAKSVLHEQTRCMRKWMRKKSRSIHADNKIKRKAVEKFAKNPIGKDIIVTNISAAFLGMGALVHLPQTYMGWNMYQNTGDMNGHLLGAGGVAVAYGLLAAHKLREVPRLKHAYNDLKKVTPELWDNRMRHEIIGHLARKEYGQQALFVGLPLVGIMGKGAAYMYESTHLHHWDLETFTSIPDKISKFDAKAALDYVTQSDPSTILNAIGNIDYSNTMTMGASAIMFAAGAIFLKSGWDETVEDFGRVSKYGFHRYIKNPINKSVDNIRHDINNYLETRANKADKWVWEKAIHPMVKAITPDWMRHEPYYKKIKADIEKEVIDSMVNFDTKLDTVWEYDAIENDFIELYDTYDEHLELDEEEDNTPSSPEIS